MPTWTGGGVNNNWSTAGNWDTGVPTAAQPAIFDGVTGVNPNKNVTITSGATCASITFVGYTGEANFTNNLTVAGNITFGTGMSFNSAGTANLVCTGNGTLTSNGKTFPGGITLQHSTFSLITLLADNWTILGSLTRAGSNGPALRGQTITRTLSVNGSVLFGGGISCSLLTIKMTGTGNLSGSTSGCTIEIDTPTGAISHNATLSLNAVIFRWIQGTFNSTASLELTNNTPVLDNVGSISFFNLSFPSTTGGLGCSILSNVNVANDITSVGSYAIDGAFTVFVKRNIAMGAGQTLSGTATIVMDGSTSASIAAGAIRNNLTINKSGTPTPATVTLNSFTWGGIVGRTLQRTAGNINPAASTITIPAGNVTINNMVFNNLTVSALTTINQNTANTINGTLLLNGSTAFAGTAGWTCATLINTTNNSTITLQNSVTYRTTTGVQLVSSLTTQPITMQSVNASIRAIWTLDYGATQNIIYVNGTRIDSSLGQIIWTFGGLISNTPLGAETLNWRTGTRPGTIAYTFLT
jgi:hypothetical protein